MKLIEFCGKAYILSGWDSEEDCLRRKFWISDQGVLPAVSMILVDSQYKIIIYSPVGELIEVYATSKKRLAFALIRETLSIFLDVGKVSIFKLSKEQRQWLGH